MLDSDSSDDLTSGASGGINGDRGWRTMSTSRARIILLLVLVFTLLQLLITLVEASRSQIESPSW